MTSLLFAILDGFLNEDIHNLVEKTQKFPINVQIIPIIEDSI